MIKIKSSDKLAVSSDDGVYSYRELLSVYKTLRQNLLDLGIKKGDIVVFIGGRTVNLVPIVLALSKIQAIYLPVSLKSLVRFNKEDYLGYNLHIIVEDSLLDQHILNNISKEIIPISTLITSNETKDFGECKELTIDIDHDELLYIIRTSGTTGNPKSVKIKSQGVYNLIEKNPIANINSEDKVLALSDISFDASIFELWTSIINNIPIIFVTDEEKIDVQLLLDRVLSTGANISLMMTPYFRFLLKENVDILNNMRIIFFGGEYAKFSSKEETDILELIHKSLNLYSVYGVTEHTILSTYKKVNQVRDLYSVGEVIKGNKLYLEGVHQNIILESEQKGEIILEGVQVADGYINSQQNFEINKLGSKIYRTRDIGMFRNDQLHIRGRMDNQLKVSGYRVDGSEIIETFLNIFPECQDASVVSKDNKIYLFYKQTDQIKISYPIMKNKMLKRLPSYSIPNRIIGIDNMPLNKNDKIDSAALIKKIDKVNETYYIDNNISNYFKKILMQEYGIKEDSFNHTLLEAGVNSIGIMDIHSKIQIYLNKKINIAIFLGGKNIKELEEILNNEYLH